MATKRDKEWRVLPTACRDAQLIHSLSPPLKAPEDRRAVLPIPEEPPSVSEFKSFTGRLPWEQSPQLPTSPNNTHVLLVDVFYWWSLRSEQVGVRKIGNRHGECEGPWTLDP